ncbi:MAG: hypothetical protein EOP40_06570 [Rubrivivax sp.]|nr:MAG: hypothetical protein EOP40_06570 [Rubrivivax sp.]
MADLVAPPTPLPLPHHGCPLCGGPNGCAPAALGRFDVPCWCRDAKVSPEALARVPPHERGQSCLCARCASATRLPHETAP